LSVCSTTTSVEAEVKSDNSQEGEELDSGNGDEADSDELNLEIADDEIIKISLSKIVRESDDVFGDSIDVEFMVDNKLDKLITVQARQVSADNLMVDETILIMSQDISAGKSAKAKLEMIELDGYDFPTLEEILELDLLVIDGGTFEDIKSYPVSVELK